MSYTLYYHQLNVRIIDNELKQIQELATKENAFTIGFEITHELLSKFLDLNIDPQHNIHNIKTEKTCVEELINILPELKIHFQHKDIWLFFLKTDLDSIAAAAVLNLYLEKNSNLYNEDVQARIFNIANYDRHGREWSPKFSENDLIYSKTNIKTLSEYSKNKIPRGLFMLISGWKNSLTYKINTMKDWILTGSFKDIEKYNQMAISNFKESLTNSKVEIIIPNQVVFVKSNKRGACGIGYQFAPVVIAMNPSFRFGFGEKRIYGRKWVIAQCDSGFIPICEILHTALELELGWGGSETIIGSPQDRPSRIIKEDIIDIVSRITKKSFQTPRKKYE